MKEQAPRETLFRILNLTFSKDERKKYEGREDELLDIAVDFVTRPGSNYTFNMVTGIVSEIRAFHAKKISTPQGVQNANEWVDRFYTKYQHVIGERFI